ncbi:hypothetical protein OROMI_002096 [Orobanche minor]
MLKIYVPMSLSIDWGWRDPVDIFPGVEMRSLKLLVVSLGKSYYDTTHPLPMSELIRASPCLQRLVIEATHQHTELENVSRDGVHGRIIPRAYFDNEDGGARMYYDGEIPRTYFHLKEVEFVGYRNVTNHFNMVQNGVTQKNIIVDPRSFKLCDHRLEGRFAGHNFEDEMVARAHAKDNLKKYVPSRINGSYYLSCRSSKLLRLAYLAKDGDTCGPSRLRSISTAQPCRFKNSKDGRCKYVEWVNRLILSLISSDSTNLHEFRVLFDLSESETQWIDDWLSFAVSRKVERIELILIDVISIDRRHYNFPYKSGNFSSNLRVLKKLSLKSVNVNGEDIGFLLGNCPLLGELYVSVSKDLNSLEIIGTFPSFKCLEIYLCPNLNSFVGILGMFRSVLPQLHMLKIYVPTSLSIDWRWRDPVDIFPDVEMRSLKLLVVSLGKSYYDTTDPLPMSELIRASPCLQRLVIEATHQHTELENVSRDGVHGRIIPRAYFDDEDGGARMYYDGEIPRAYFHLKKVKFVGYRGVTNHFNMIMELVRNGVALKNLIVDPRSFELCEHRLWDRVAGHNFEDEMVARAHAKDHLKKHVPSRINVEIL